MGLDDSLPVIEEHKKFDAADAKHKSKTTKNKKRKTYKERKTLSQGHFFAARARLGSSKSDRTKYYSDTTMLTKGRLNDIPDAKKKK